MNFRSSYLQIYLLKGCTYFTQGYGLKARGQVCLSKSKFKHDYGFPERVAIFSRRMHIVHYKLIVEVLIKIYNLTQVLGDVPSYMVTRLLLLALL